MVGDPIRVLIGIEYGYPAKHNGKLNKIAYCPLFGLGALAETHEKAREALEEKVQKIIEKLEKKGRQVIDED